MDERLTGVEYVVTDVHLSGEYQAIKVEDIQEIRPLNKDYVDQLNKLGEQFGFEVVECSPTVRFDTNAKWDAAWLFRVNEREPIAQLKALIAATEDEPNCGHIPYPTFIIEPNTKIRLTAVEPNLIPGVNSYTGASHEVGDIIALMDFDNGDLIQWEVAACFVGDRNGRDYLDIEANHYKFDWLQDRGNGYERMVVDL